MSIAAIVLLAVAAAVLSGLLVWRFMTYRGQRVIICPETQQPAGVELNAWLAARTPGDANLRLQSCSRWPERSDCGQDCLTQIAASPDGTLVRNIVAAWYGDQQCVFCHRMIGTIEWHEAIPALRASDGSLKEWEGIAAQDVPAILETHNAVCWNCNLTEGFRGDHSELVIDRAQTPLRDLAIH